MKKFIGNLLYIVGASFLIAALLFTSVSNAQGMLDPVLRALIVNGYDGAGAYKVSIGASTKPFIIPAYQLGDTYPLDTSAGATVRVGPLPLGTYKVGCNTSVYLDQGTVAVTSTVDDDIQTGGFTFMTVTAGMDYISAINELGAIASSRCTFSAVTIP